MINLELTEAEFEAVIMTLVTFTQQCEAALQDPDAPQEVKDEALQVQELLTTILMRAAKQNDILTYRYTESVH